jgi:hypothetical protein
MRDDRRIVANHAARLDEPPHEVYVFGNAQGRVEAAAQMLDVANEAGRGQPADR